MAAPSGGSSSTLAKLSMPVRIALGAGLFILFGAAYWLVFYTEVSAKIDAANRQGDNLLSELAKQKEAQASYFADRDELALRQQRQRELNKALPAETEAAAFLSSIQQVSNVSGVDLKGWQPVEEKNEAFYAKVPMKLELTGRFHQVAKFAYEMGKLERIINIENIELTDPHLEGDEVKLKAHCLATTFHVPKPKTPPRAAGTPAPGGKP
jgi:type IV pilus assembly protein PilO